MTPLQTIELRQSERKQRLNQLAQLPELSPDQVDELNKLSEAVDKGEIQYRAAIKAQENADAQASSEPDRVELRSRAKITDYLSSARKGISLTGASAELNQELGLRSNEIPLELVGTPVETRAVTPAPTTGTGVSTTPIEQFVYASSVASQLGVWMQQVERGQVSVPRISTALTAAGRAEGSAVVAGAGALTTTVLDPHRISARLEWTAESELKSGMSDWESAWRMHLSHALSARLDEMLLRNQDQASYAHLPDGILGSLSVDAETTRDSFDTALAKFANLIDGKWARSLSEIRVLCNGTVMSFMERTFRDLAVTVRNTGGSQNVGGYGSNGDVSLATYLRMYSAGVMSHARMPPNNNTSNTGETLAFLSGDGTTPRPHTAVCAYWPHLEITDIYSESAKAITSVTLHSFVSDVQILQADAYSLLSIKTA